MRNQQLEEKLFNEILFEKRNKNYGAYVLRNEADRILTKSLFFGVGILAAFSMTPLLIKALKQEVKKSPVEVRIKLINPVLPPENTIVSPKQTSQEIKNPEIKTIDKTVPEPTANVKNEIKPEKIEGAIAGTQNNSVGENAPPNTYIPTTAPTIQTGPPALPKPVESVKPVDPKAIPPRVDIEASFPGGLDSFRKKVMSNFDGSGLEAGEVMKTTVTFIVETDGSISEIKAKGKISDFNNEAIRTVKSIKGKWIPAKFKNQAVRSYFTLPITMTVDN